MTLGMIIKEGPFDKISRQLDINTILCSDELLNKTRTYFKSVIDLRRWSIKTYKRKVR